MNRELRPVQDSVSCDVCGRTILKGERTTAFVSPDRREHEVCELCVARAESLGWIRASVADETFARAPRPEPRRSLLGRLAKRRPEPARAPAAEPAEQLEPELDAGGDGAEPPPADSEEAELSPPAPERSRPKHPRHVRALPTTPDAKIERALDLFNGSDHQRTVAGLTRTLGAPWVAAVPQAEEHSIVTVVVAWELSWYRFRIDLGDATDPVTLAENGEELDQIDETLRDWNATIDADGRLMTGDAVAGGGAGDR